MGFRFRFFITPLRRELRLLMKDDKTKYNFIEYRRYNVFHYLRRYYSKFIFLKKEEYKDLDINIFDSYKDVTYNKDNNYKIANKFL